MAKEAGPTNELDRRMFSLSAVRTAVSNLERHRKAFGPWQNAHLDRALAELKLAEKWLDMELASAATPPPPCDCAVAEGEPDVEGIVRCETCHGVMIAATLGEFTARLHKARSA
jgi:hypothetical protein